MRKPDIFKDFMSMATDRHSEKILARTLQALEDILGYPEASHCRINYLESLAAAHDISRDKIPTAIPDPLSLEQHRSLVRKGLLAAYNDGDVELEQLAHLAHSVEGLRTFTDELCAIPPQQHAVCWGDALNKPFDAPNVDLSDVFAKAGFAETGTRVGIDEESSQPPRETLIGHITRWIESLAPAQPIPVLGFRGSGQVVKTPDIREDSALIHSGRMIEQLNTIADKDPELLPQSIRDAWVTIPWRKIGNGVSEKISWGDFADLCSSILLPDCQADGLKRLYEWISSDPGPLKKHTSEIQLMKFILYSAIEHCD